MQKPALFDLWDIPAVAAGETALSFDVNGEGSQPPVWRMVLDRGPDSAEQELEGYRATIEAYSAALDSLPERIDSLLAQGRPGTSYAINTAPLSPAEITLLEELGEIDIARQPVSFAAGEAALADWSAVYAGFQGAARRLLDMVSHLAWVETQLEGGLLARTTVGWTGDTETMYTDGITPKEASLHRRSLEIAVASRNIWMRAITAALAGAAKCSVLLATPGGALLALPAVWKYINQILAQVEEYQRLHLPSAAGHEPRPDSG